MKTEHALARCLKEMMAPQPLDAISVVEISSKCGVSRKTFYYHYHDIYDLLTQVFLDEKIPNVHLCNNYMDLLEIIWKYYKNNEGFINATLASAGKELFSEFIYNVYYTTTMRFINRIDENKSLNISPRKSIARFYASAYSNSIVYYLSNYKNKTYAGLESCFFFVSNSSLEKSVHNAIKKIENDKKL